MSKFRRISSVIEAEMYLGPVDAPKGVYFDEANRPYVVTIHNQRVFIEISDWIIPEKDGVHYYPCKHEVFVQTYEPV